MVTPHLVAIIPNRKALCMSQKNALAVHASKSNTETMPRQSLLLHLYRARFLSLYNTLKLNLCFIEALQTTSRRWSKRGSNLLQLEAYGAYKGLSKS